VESLEVLAEILHPGEFPAPYTRDRVGGVRLTKPDRSEGELWIVCHGRGRGRRHGLAQRLTTTAAKDQPWRPRVRVHETGSPLPDVSHARAVVFWLADPLRELYPACFEEASAIAAAARGAGARVVNPPEALSNTIKCVQAERWQSAGLPAATAREFRTRAELDALLSEASYPVIVRPDRLHAQRSTFYCTNLARARAVAAHVEHFPGVILPFIDTREGYQRSQPGSVWARFFHKKRAMVIGDEVVSNHVFFSEHPICGLKGSTFARYAGRGRHWSALARLVPTDRATLAVDDAFWRGAPEHASVMLGATRTLDLDIAAIDYSTTADGGVVLWEANPYFAMPKPEDGVMPRERHLEQRVAGFHRAIGRFLAKLLGEVA
jgi:hypothetical protein